MNIEKIVARNGYLVDADTGEKVLFYECDPQKNTECDKSLCRANLAEDDGILVFVQRRLIQHFVKTEADHFMLS